MVSTSVERREGERERERARTNFPVLRVCVCVSFTYQLLAYIGKHEGYPTYVAIKVSRNFDCDLLFFVWKGAGEAALILDLLKQNGMG